MSNLVDDIERVSKVKKLNTGEDYNANI